MIRGLFLGLIIGYCLAMLLVSVQNASPLAKAQKEAFKAEILHEHYSDLIKDMGVIPPLPLPTAKPF
jgi:hypothetical protein